MPLLDLAKQALEYSRTCLWNKAQNKGYRNSGNPSLPPPEKLLNYHPTRVAMKEARYDQLKHERRRSGLNCKLTHEQVLQYAQMISPLGVGNSEEYAALAYSFLFRHVNRPPHLDIINMRGHFVVVIGQPYSEPYPSMFSNWDSGAVFCDPWANLSGHIRQFLDLWHTQMGKWHARDLILKGATPEKTWTPMHKYWYRRLSDYPKVSALRRM